MTKEYQAFQKLEEVLQSKKTVLQSCIQEWEPVIQALEAIEAARQEDLKREEDKKRKREVKKAEELTMFQKLQQLQPGGLEEKLERLKQEQEKKEIRWMVEQIKKDRFAGWTDDGSKKDKNGEPITAKDLMLYYNAMMPEKF